MRHTMGLFFGAMIMLWAVSANAQHMGHHDADKQMPMGESGGMNCMMHDDMMMGQMMNHPMRHARMLISVLPAMKESLALSDQQVAEISKIKADYESQRAELAKKIGEAEARLDDVVAGESTDLAQVTPILHEAANLSADLDAAGLSAAMSMKSRLSEDQRAKLDPTSMRQYMMQNMTMMDMMQVMHPEMESGMMNMMHGSHGDMEGMKGSMNHGGMTH